MSRISRRRPACCSFAETAPSPESEGKPSKEQQDQANLGSHDPLDKDQGPQQYHGFYCIRKCMRLVGPSHVRASREQQRGILLSNGPDELLQSPVLSFN